MKRARYWLLIGLGVLGLLLASCDSGLRRERTWFQKGFDQCYSSALAHGEDDLDTSTLRSDMEFSAFLADANARDEMKEQARGAAELARMQTAFQFGLAVVYGCYRYGFFEPRGVASDSALRDCNRDFVKYLKANKRQVMGRGWKAYLTERKFNFQQMN